MEFREAFADARAEANNSPESDEPGAHDWCLVFLKALEASGWKLMGPEPTWQMNTAAPSGDCWPHRNIYGDLDRTDCESAAAEIFKAMHAAAPTVTELVGEK